MIASFHLSSKFVAFSRHQSRKIVNHGLRYLHVNIEGHEWELGQWGIFKDIINQWQSLKKFLFIMSIIYTDIICNQQSPSTKNDNGDCEKIWKIAIEIKNLPKNLKNLLLKILFFSMTRSVEVSFLSKFANLKYLTVSKVLPSK